MTNIIIIYMMIETKRYLCDFCSRPFWHFGEFTVHRASHTGIKPFKCGRCGEKSFASAERLTKHLKRCGINNSIVCNKCGKGYSDAAGLATHIRDFHQTNTFWQCPFCDRRYNSQGGYYGHLRSKHDIGRNGKSLSSALIDKAVSEWKSQNPNTSKDSNDLNSQPSPKNTVENVQNSSQENEEDKSNHCENEPTPKNGSPGEGKKDKEMTHKCPFPNSN